MEPEQNVEGKTKAAPNIAHSIRWGGGWLPRAMAYMTSSKQRVHVTELTFLTSALSATITIQVALEEMQDMLSHKQLSVLTKI
jgi:hypothetical protein